MRSFTLMCRLQNGKYPYPFMNKAKMDTWYGLAAVALVSIIVMQVFFTLGAVIARVSTHMLYKESLDARRSRALHKVQAKAA